MKIRIAKKILKGIFDSRDYSDCLISNISNNCYELSEFCMTSNVFKDYNFKRNNKQTITKACKTIVNYRRNKFKNTKGSNFKYIVL